jgi:ribosome maturation factor RimP
MCLNTATEKDLREELGSVAQRCGCELLHLEFKGGVLRLILDSEGGVTLGQCERVSRETSAFLDAMDFGPGKYTLEVSSPGLDRKFYRREDYTKFTGRQVRITWQEATMPHKRTLVGTLARYEPADPLGPEVELDAPGERLRIRLQDIVTTRLEPEL